MAMCTGIEFRSLSEFIVKHAEVYLRYEPRDPYPKWWDSLRQWVYDRMTKELLPDMIVLIDGRYADATVCLDDFPTHVEAALKIIQVACVCEVIEPWFEEASADFASREICVDVTLRTEAFGNFEQQLEEFYL